MKYILSLSLALLFVVNSVFSAENQSFFESVTKVYNKSGSDYGSGDCVNIDDNYIYILTNRHVVGNSKIVSVEFYRQGHQSVYIPATVIWTAYKDNEPVDIALLAVDRKKLDWTPAIVKFDPSDKLYSKGDTVITIGCPQAEWPRAYKGHIVEVSGGTYTITPNVEPGQSGSILMNADGTKAIGLIAWTSNGYGKAMTSEVIKKAIYGQNTNYYFKQPYKLSNCERISAKTAISNFIEETCGFRRGGCPNCGPNNCPNCGPNGCRPHRRINPDDNSPDDNSPNEIPETPDDNSPNDNNGGIKIFPTFPNDPTNPPTPNPTPNPKPATPIIPATPTGPTLDQYNTLEKRVTELEKKHTSDYNDLTKKISDIDNKKLPDTVNIDNQLASHNHQLTDLNGIVQKLQSELDKKPGKQDVINPNQFDILLRDSPVIKDIKDTQKNFLTAQDINNLSQGLQNKLDQTKTDVSKQINNSTQQQNQAILGIFKDTLTKIAQNKDVPVSTSTVLNSYGTTALGTLIPSSVLLVLGYLFRNVLKTFTEQYISGHFGGVVAQDPFQKLQKTPT